MDPELTKIHAKLDQLANAVADVRGLVGAAYERMEGGRERLERLRNSDTWRRAYSEHEPLITVRIPTWNRAELLVERALASVLRQTYARWEAVVVGDGCTDDTQERLAALADPRIRFHNLPANGPYPENKVQRWRVAGVPALNASLRMANGSWIAPLDDDDEWDDDHLEQLLAAAREDEAEFVYGRCRCSHDGALTDRTFGAWPPRAGEINLIATLYNAALREFEHDQVSGFLNEVNDWNLIRRMWEAGVRFKFLDRVVATYSLDHLSQLRRRRDAEQVAGE